MIGRRMRLLVLADIDAFHWEYGAGEADAVHLGFEGLTKYLARARPKVLVHGHQHRNCETHVEGTRVVGVHGNAVIEI